MQIIIMQTSNGGRRMCAAAMALLNLEEEKDYKIFSGLPGVEDAVTADKEQLFITGSFFGEESDVSGFVQGLRDKNQKLVCMSFAASPVVGPFDADIPKNLDSVENLVSAIRGFRSGLIKRREIKSEVTPFSLEKYNRLVDVLNGRTRERMICEMLGEEFPIPRVSPRD